MKVIKIVLKLCLPLILLAGGLAGMKTMVASRQAPQKEAKERRGALVEVIEARSEDRRIMVRGTGTIQTHREVTVTPQVSGRIVAVSPEFVAGGFFQEGELLFEIEKIDYELALDGARAARAQAELVLAQQESNAQIARQEWKRLARVGRGEPNPLVLYEPQMKQATASLAAADTAIKKAELDLQRTRVHAPFNCRVRTEQVDIGQFLRAGVAVGTVAGSDTAEIVVPLAQEEARRLKIPRPGKEGKGSAATVEIGSGDRSYRWKGRVVRSLGEVDPMGRMTRVVVTVDDPYHLRTPRSGGRPDLEVGLFVDLSFQADLLKGVFSVPSRALRQNSIVWIADDNDTLRVRPVKVARRETETVIISDGVEVGDRVIVSSLAGAAEGMKLRVVMEEVSQ